MFRVIKGKKHKVNYKEIYARLFDNNLNKYNENKEDKRTLKQIIYYGVKFTNEVLKENLEYEQKLKLFELIEIIKEVMALLTPNELITIFPIDKTYDGNKYEMKDYFYTMKELKRIGMNSAILSNVENLLWDYENREIRFFLTNSISVLSDLQKIETGKSIAEMWAEKNNVETYMLCKDETINKEYLYNPKTGKSMSVKRAIPKYLKVIK